MTPNQYPNYKTSNEIKPTNKCKGAVVIIDDMLGAKNSSQIDESFRRGRHEDLDVYFISQSYFALPRQSIRKNSDRLILFKQRLWDVQSMYYKIGAYDMKYDEFQEIMVDRGILASYLMTPLSKITNLETSTAFKLVKDHNSNRVNDLLINKSIPITFHDNLLTFRDTGREFELKGDLLKMLTNKNYNADLASLSDKKIMYDFAKEINFGTKAQGKNLLGIEHL